MESGWLARDRTRCLPLIRPIAHELVEENTDMKPYPHTYAVTADGSASGEVSVVSRALPALSTAPPPEFDGPGGVWSPETLLIAAVADCFILTFRVVARMGRFEWVNLEAHVDGTLDRESGVTQFVRYSTRAVLTVHHDADHAKARELLERAERNCLVSNSLRGARTLEVQICEVAAA
jgi:organic hydroperoxide reductase OsmC/OhrA